MNFQTSSPPPSIWYRLSIAIVFGALAGCAAAPDEGVTVQLLPSPTTSPAAQARLAQTAAGEPLLSWIERPDREGPHQLKAAVLRGGAWDELGTIAAGDDWFVNWADFPTVAVVDDSIMFAHYLRKTGPETYAYHVMLTRSGDGGRTWDPAARLHTDSSNTEHGFVSMVALENGLMTAWLDGREMQEAGGHGTMAPMTLRAAFVGKDGDIRDRMEIDALVCDCCQTAAVRSGGEVLVAYRDRSDREIRDIYVSRFDGTTWSEGKRVEADDWMIPGCPVNGPAMDARGDSVAVAWFTAADDQPRVQIALSNDAGRTFAAAQRVDDGQPLGRVDVAFLQDGSLLVVWVEHSDDAAVIRGRRIAAGDVGAAFDIASTSASRSSGFPSMIATGQGIYLTRVMPHDGGESRVEVYHISSE